MIDFTNMPRRKKAYNGANEMNFRIFEIPLSGIRLNGEKIRYFDFISSLTNKDCNDALKRVLPRIDMKKISELISNIPYISEVQKRFYITMLAERKEKILDKSLQLLLLQPGREEVPLQAKNIADIDRIG